MGEHSRAAPVVVVTGASAGLGRAIAVAFGARGASLGLLARNTARLESAAREVRDAGGHAIPIAVDVSDSEAVERAADAVEERLGPIDVWVNNAMVTVFGPVKAVTAEEVQRVTDVTYMGCVHGTLASLRRMLPRDRGHIIQVGSALAYRGIPLQAAYCAAKHAVQGFTESLRCELLHDGSRVRVSMVQMPGLNTPQFRWSRSKMPRRAQPMPPFFQPEVGAEAVLHAYDAGRDEMYVGFPTVKAVVGNRIAPRLLDRYLARTAYDGQQTAEPEDPGRGDNLFDAVPGDPGARGPFEDRARHFSPQLWASERRGPLALAAGVVAGLAVALVARPLRTR